VYRASLKEMNHRSHPDRGGFFPGCPQAGRPRHRNTAASGLISLRSITPAKAAYAVTGFYFLLLNVKTRPFFYANLQIGCNAEFFLIDYSKMGFFDGLRQGCGCVFGVILGIILLILLLTLL
jgi:hypothetical protein